MLSQYSSSNSELSPKSNGYKSWYIAEEARDNAWKQCMNGADPNQVDQFGVSGSETRGIAVTFGPTRLNLIETVDAVENTYIE